MRFSFHRPAGGVGRVSIEIQSLPFPKAGGIKSSHSHSGTCTQLWRQGSKRCLPALRVLLLGRRAQLAKSLSADKNDPQFNLVWTVSRAHPQESDDGESAMIGGLASEMDDGPPWHRGADAILGDGRKPEHGCAAEERYRADCWEPDQALPEMERRGP